MQDPLLKDIPTEEVEYAIERALKAGADKDSLEFLGAGQEGFVFGDKQAAYKVARDPENWSFSTTAAVLSAVEATEAAPFVVSLYGYYPKEEVLVVERVEGPTGRWLSPVRETYDYISDVLDSLDYSPPEFKESSFVQRQDGTWVMVDLGFVYPLRERAAKELAAKIRKLDKTVDFFSLSSDIVYVNKTGLLDSETAKRYLKKIYEVYGGEKASHVADLLDLPALRKAYFQQFLKDFRKNPARARHVDCEALGNLVQAVAGSNEAFELLDKEELDSFQTGGCAILAAAVEKVFGLQQATISSDVNDAEHIVNYCEGGFIDSDGWQTKEQLFEKLDMESSSPRRWRVRRGVAEHDFVCPRYLVEELAALLEAHVPRKNPARARRSERRKIEKRSVDDFGEEWVDTDYKWIEHPPFLTEGHFDLPMVKEAARIASRAKESKQLGRGHFGEAFLVETSKGPVIVKIAAERMLYQDRRPWTREEQQANLMHEAGVANELEEMGYDIAPRSVYVELEDGTPAIVREYGEEVEPGEISGQEYYELERALFDLEKDTGWSVQDELLLLQRPDGSLFIGDVGIWSAPDVKKRREWRLINSHLPSLLGNLGERLFGQRFSSLDEVQTYQERLEEHSREGRDPDHVFTKIFREELEKVLASREAVGIPSPSKAYRILESARYGE